MIMNLGFWWAACRVPHFMIGTRGRRWRIVAVAAAVATLATACTPSARWVPVGPSTGAATVDWQDCAKEARAIGGATLPRNLTFDCGTVTVPRDWATAK